MLGNISEDGTPTGRSRGNGQEKARPGRDDGHGQQTTHKCHLKDEGFRWSIDSFSLTDSNVMIEFPDLPYSSARASHTIRGRC